jgi:hypothetical protein
MPQVTVTLPSGMRGTIRSLRGKEINLFANMSNAKANATTLKILTNVWQETHEDGACYEFAEGVEWGKVLQCDRFTALLYARVATWGAEYSFRLHCGSCRKRYDWSLDLTELEMKPLPEASVETFKAGNKFATTVLDEAGESRRVAFQLLTPKLEAKIEQAANLSTAERVTAALAQRIVTVEGLDEGKGAIKAWLNDLPMGSMYDLIESLDEHDGGIETEIEVECPHCGAGEEIDLPLDRREFWSPRKLKRS